MNNQEEFVTYENEMEDDDDDDDDDDVCDETEEEDILVYVEFEGPSESNIFCNEKLQLDMIALKLWTEKRNDRMNALDEFIEKQKQREEKRRQGIELNSESDDDMPYAFNIDNPNDPPIDLTTIANDKNTKPNYKSKYREINQELTVIDPGPSTSKDSVPWVNPKLEANSDSDDESLSRDEGEGEGVPTREPEQSTNESNEDNIDESEAAEILNRDPDDIVASCLLASDETSMDQDTSLNDNDNDKNGDNENDDTDMNEEEITNSESSDKLEDTIEDKKAEKEKKREAKMKEITDRLKKKARDEKTISEM
ncbi:Protein of unknown function [Cotesia congregata]|uniref:Uncharacterized protein n=1 Tax=Cotesia congregata TaxID=51543 RepID=A0A8J2HH60_COTCN|nr:Protein of unknown function [Cotesia congregata]